MGQTKRNILLTKVANLCPKWPETMFSYPDNGVDDVDQVLRQIQKMGLYANVGTGVGCFEAVVRHAIPGAPTGPGFGSHKILAAHALLWALVDYLEKMKK